MTSKSLLPLKAKLCKCLCSLSAFLSQTWYNQSFFLSPQKLLSWLCVAIPSGHFSACISLSLSSALDTQITLLLARQTFLLEDINVFPFFLWFYGLQLFKISINLPQTTAIKVVEFLDLVLEFLCLYDFLRDRIWFRQYVKWIVSIYMLSVFRSIVLSRFV